MGAPRMGKRRSDKQPNIVFLLDTEKAAVLRHAPARRERAGPDLAGAARDRQGGDEHVLGLRPRGARIIGVQVFAVDHPRPENARMRSTSLAPRAIQELAEHAGITDRLTTNRSGSEISL